MQNYFVADGMPACAPEARTIVPNINRLARAMRATGGLVIWIQTAAHIADPQDWANRQEAMSAAGWAKRQALLAPSGDGFPLYPTCEVLPEDKIILKSRYSAFIPHPSALDDLLRTHGIDTLLITGVATSTCCESTARDAAMWGYRTIMVSDGNADQTDALHNHTLGKFLVTFGDARRPTICSRRWGLRRRRTEGIPIHESLANRATALSRALAVNFGQAVNRDLFSVGGHRITVHPAPHWVTG